MDKAYKQKHVYTVTKGGKKYSGRGNLRTKLITQSRVDEWARGCIVMMDGRFWSNAHIGVLGKLEEKKKEKHTRKKKKKKSHSRAAVGILDADEY